MRNIRTVAKVVGKPELSLCDHRYYLHWVVYDDPFQNGTFTKVADYPDCDGQLRIFSAFHSGKSRKIAAGTLVRVHAEFAWFGGEKLYFSDL